MNENENASNLPNVKSDVTPSVTRAGIASGLIQNEIHDMTTIKAEGMYVWNKWYPKRRLKLNITARHVKLPEKIRPVRVQCLLKIKNQ